MCYQEVRLSSLTVILGWSVLVLADGADNVTSLFDFFPELLDLQKPSRINPFGGQNFTRCCLQAVYDSYQVVDGQVTPNPAHPFILLPPNALADTVFPCGATYNGSAAGAPVVSIPYSWCASNCNGWQVSSNTILTQWIQPFVGFILPAAVFCLNVPRKRALEIKDGLFRDHLPEFREHWRELMRRILCIKPPPRRRMSSWGSSIVKVFTGSITKPEPTQISFVQHVFNFVVQLATIFVYGLLVVLEMMTRGFIAALIALVDTIVWLTVVFAVASPMILSGLYEAAVDRLVIESLEKALRNTLDENDGHALRHRIHLMYGVLVGNLVLHDPSSGQQPAEQAGEEVERSAWDDVCRMVDSISDNPSQDREGMSAVRRSTHVRLMSMLGCQSDFGATIGAAVVFFLGSFLFSVFANLSMLGDNDTAHSMGFGEWWMIIPHVAMVSGCLLAGNNPNTLEAIFSGVETWEVKSDSKMVTVAQGVKDFFLRPYGPVYRSVYQPVWMWERGRNKRSWIRRIQSRYSSTAPQPSAQHLNPSRPERNWAAHLRTKYGYATEHVEFSAPIPESMPNIGMLDWVWLLVHAVILNALPFLFAFLTSYYTPPIGLSCRSFTFLLYFLFQIWLSAIWFWDFPSEQHFDPWYRIGQKSNKERGDMAGSSSYWIRVPSLMTVLTLFGVIGSAFTAIFGTIFQLVGIYRNCKCLMPLSAWGQEDFFFQVSTNSAEGITYAQKYWMTSGVASIALLIVICYVGWWYQRHQRRSFTELVDKLLISCRSGNQDRDRRDQEEVDPRAVIA